MEEFKKFSEIKYVRPDFKQVKKQISSCLNEMKKANDYATFKQKYKEIEAILCENMTMTTVAHIRGDLDKSDKFYEEENKFLNKAGASLGLSMIKVMKFVANCKFEKEINEDYGPFMLQDMKIQQKLMSPKILLLTVKEGTLKQKYSKDAALCKTNFRGEECNFYGLLKHMLSIDREERKEAFNAWADLYESVSEKLDATYDELIKVRTKISKKLGFDSFIDYIYLNRGRYDYNAKDAEHFRNEVRDYIVPICQKLYEKQKEELGIDVMHMYDEGLTFKDGNANPIGTKDELVEKARLMYEEMSKETGEYFNFMVEHELFDLETKTGKRLGGYCTFLPSYQAPFIFSNFNGTSADVDVLTHEAGHAFEAYYAFRHIDSKLQTGSTSEINEIHSMTMEHFAYPYMDKFFGENADKYRYHHLCQALEAIPYLVSVDEFQHRVFENPKMTAMERRQAWKKIEETYMPWRDYDGNKFLSEGGFWMQKQHIFLYPFYYIDYALAQTCAFQLFIRDLDNHEIAWNDYMNLCSKGGTMGYFDLLKVANLENPFKEGTVKKVAENIEKVIETFEEKIKK